MIHWKGSTTVHIQLWVQPKASKTEVVGPYKDAIKIRVASPPVEGKANEEVIRFLSKQLKVPKSQIQIIKGLSSRNKLVEIVGVDPAQVQEVFQEE